MDEYSSSGHLPQSAAVKISFHLIESNYKKEAIVAFFLFSIYVAVNYLHQVEGVEVLHLKQGSILLSMVLL